MKITYRGDYALKAMLDLALNYDNGVATIPDIAKRTDSPTKFLEQVLLDLKRGGFVESKRGKVGGYFLSRPPSQIKLGQIIRFVDGPIEPIGCVEKKYSGCEETEGCVFKKIWRQVTNLVSGVVDNITFEDLINQVKGTKGFTYSI